MHVSNIAQYHDDSSNNSDSNSDNDGNDGNDDDIQSSAFTGPWV